jgi:dTDP-4-amino-4,6-dideoxygalactose transaminase
MTGNHHRPLMVGRPNTGNRRMFDRLVDGIFERRWFTNNGELVNQLEARLCGYLGVRHCIPVCNATVALQIVCQALDLGGEIIVPAFTFVATPHSVQWEGHTPVFCDIEPHTHLIDPAQVEALITPRTTAILGVHVWGRACHPARLQAIADRHGLALYFDAAHAFGCGHDGKMIGNFGRCEVFSFHATKFFNTFEGGAIATNDDELAARIRLMINFGFSDIDQVVHLGTNGKMSEIHAAMGLSCFDSLERILAINRRHYDAYRRRLEGLPGVRFCHYDDVELSNYQYVAIELDPAQAGITRDGLMAVLHEHGIMARRYFHPGCHRMEPYASLRRTAGQPLPVTETVCQNILVLPTGSGVDAEDITRVAGLIAGRLGRATGSNPKPAKLSA